jgi:hypothetical protein
LPFLKKMKQSHQKIFVVFEKIKMVNNKIKYSGDIKICNHAVKKYDITFRNDWTDRRKQALCILRCIEEEEGSFNLFFERRSRFLDS